MDNFKCLAKTIFNVLIRLLLIGAFVLVFVTYMSKVLRPHSEETDNVRDKVDGFYALEENSLDVLILGSSHAYTGFNPSVLYHYTNASSYDFGGQCQPIEVTYHYLVEALKTQSPKVVVLDVFALTNESDKCQIDGVYRANIQDLKLSENKYEAYAVNDEETALINCFDMFLYKDRLEDITLEDLKKAYVYNTDEWFGYTFLYPANNEELIREDVFSDVKTAPSDRRLAYLLKIIDLCEANEIELICVKTPYYVEEEDLSILNYVWDICDNKGIAYIDYTDEAVLNKIDYHYEQDGDSWHANAAGSYKVTKELSSLLNEKYTFDKESVYKEEYEQLYRTTVEEILYNTSSQQRMFNLITELDVTSIVVDKANRYFADSRWTVVTSEGYYEGAFVEINGHKTWVEPNGEIWYDYEQICEANGNYHIVVVDNETGELIGYYNAFDMGW